MGGLQSKKLQSWMVVRRTLDSLGDCPISINFKLSQGYRAGSILVLSMIYVGRLGYLAEIIWLFEHQTGQVYKAVNKLVVQEWHFRLSLLPYPTSKYFSDNSEGHA